MQKVLISLTLVFLTTQLSGCLLLLGGMVADAAVETAIDNSEPYPGACEALSDECYWEAEAFCLQGEMCDAEECTVYEQNLWCKTILDSVEEDGRTDEDCANVAYYIESEGCDDY